MKGAIRAAVIGNPISHSLSPKIFSFIADYLSQPIQYHPQEVTSERLPDFLRQLKEAPEWIGINITIPHKEAVLSLADSLDKTVIATGAANVVHVSEHLLHAHNTDVTGVIETLENENCEIPGQTAWIIGAGGAARAVAFALGQLKAKRVYLSNSGSSVSIERAQKLANDFTHAFPETEWIVDEGKGPLRDKIKLIVHCTPVGMNRAKLRAGQEGFFSNLARLPFADGALAFDLIYRPENTPFLKEARALGLGTVGGLDMLISQAIASWEIWFGAIPEKQPLKKALKAELRSHLKQVRPIFLTGFMGSGKSKVGQALAQKLGWDFLDTDREIEKNERLSVAEIFARDGERGFRKYESHAVSQASQTEKTVIALGGGALLDSDNLKHILESDALLIHLDASPEKLRDRIRNSPDPRPLLTDDPSLERMMTLLRQRSPGYARAKFRLETDEMTLNQIVDKICHILTEGSSQ
ncbi:MAG: shikimate kinase [Oligoflexia bacterium]|nr:shikimate kinase [Oligoflexia bacterium]